MKRTAYKLWWRNKDGTTERLTTTVQEDFFKKLDWLERGGDDHEIVKYEVTEIHEDKPKS